MSAPLALPWGSIEKGMRVELSGSAWLVEKIKRDGKAVRVTVSGVAGTFTRDVKAKDVVSIARPEPLRDRRGAQKRWAGDNEKSAAISPGDPSVTRRPAKAQGGAWEEPQGKAEKRLAKHLDATLVAEAVDVSVGYYVPPVDVSTVMAHVQLFHGWQPSDYEGERETLTAHAAEHAEIAAGTSDSILTVQHWHEKRRP